MTVRLLALLAVAALPTSARAQNPRGWLGIGIASVGRDVSDYLPGAKTFGVGGEVTFEAPAARTNDALVVRISVAEFEHRSDAIPGLNRALAVGPRLSRSSTGVLVADWDPGHSGNSGATIMSGEIGWRWYSRSSSQGVFGEIGVGASRLSSPNQQKTTRISGSAGAGYAVQLSPNLRALGLARFSWIGQENIVERGGSPRWLVPVVVGLSLGL